MKFVMTAINWFNYLFHATFITTKVKFCSAKISRVKNTYTVYMYIDYCPLIYLKIDKHENGTSTAFVG